MTISNSKNKEIKYIRICPPNSVSQNDQIKTYFKEI